MLRGDFSFKVRFMEIGGGRAGVHSYRWVQEGYNLDQVEPLRQELLAINDVGQVQKALQQVGIVVDRERELINGRFLVRGTWLQCRAP